MGHQAVGRMFCNLRALKPFQFSSLAILQSRIPSSPPVLHSCNLCYFLPLSLLSCLHCCLLPPGINNFTTPGPYCLDSGFIGRSVGNPSIFEPVSRAAKIRKAAPKASEKHHKSSLKSSEFRLLGKVGFCSHSHTKCLFWELQTLRFGLNNQ